MEWKNNLRSIARGRTSSWLDKGPDWAASLHSFTKFYQFLSASKLNCLIHISSWLHNVEHKLIHEMQNVKCSLYFMISCRNGAKKIKTWTASWRGPRGWGCTWYPLAAITSAISIPPLRASPTIWGERKRPWKRERITWPGVDPQSTPRPGAESRAAAASTNPLIPAI